MWETLRKKTEKMKTIFTDLKGLRDTTDDRISEKSEWFDKIMYISKLKI